MHSCGWLWILVWYNNFEGAIRDVAGLLRDYNWWAAIDPIGFPGVEWGGRILWGDPEKRYFCRKTVSNYSRYHSVGDWESNIIKVFLNIKKIPLIWS